MIKSKLGRMVIHIIKYLRDPYFQGFAPQIAFYFMLSIVPILILFTQILSIFSVPSDMLDMLFEEYGSIELLKVLKGLVSYTPGGTMNAAFIVLSLWAASKLYFFLARIANYALTGEVTGIGVGYLKERIRAVFTILLTLLMVAFSLIILVYGEVIIRMVIDTLLAFFDVNIDEKYLKWLKIRWPMAMLLYFLTVSYSYYVLPRRKLKFKEILPGSLFTSIMILVISLGFSLYVRNIANYSIIYGSMASIVAVLIWFYLLGWMLGIGVMVNKAWKEIHQS